MNKLKFSAFVGHISILIVVLFIFQIIYFNLYSQIYFIECENIVEYKGFKCHTLKTEYYNERSKYNLYSQRIDSISQTSTCYLIGNDLKRVNVSNIITPFLYKIYSGDIVTEREKLQNNYYSVTSCHIFDLDILNENIYISIFERYLEVNFVLFAELLSTVILYFSFVFLSIELF